MRCSTSSSSAATPANSTRLLVRVRAALAKEDPEAVQKIVTPEKSSEEKTGADEKPPEDLFQQSVRLMTANGWKDLVKRAEPVQFEWYYLFEPKLEDQHTTLRKLEPLLVEARERLGTALPPAERAAVQFSGPPANTPTEEVRRDPETRLPQLPADNSAYLGRSLFTDYLLPVELGGILLLVATIGAIAIGQRHRPASPAAEMLVGEERMTPLPLQNYLVVGAILFCLGLIGFLARRNMIVMFLSAEMMLQGVALNLVGLRPLSRQSARAGVCPVHHHRGGLRGRHRAGADPDAVQTQGVARRQPVAGTARAGLGGDPDEDEEPLPRRRRRAGDAPPDSRRQGTSSRAKRRAMSDALRPYLWLIPGLPLLASVVIAFLGPRLLRRHSHWPCILAIVGSCRAARSCCWSARRAVRTAEETHGHTRRPWMRLRSKGFAEYIRCSHWRSDDAGHSLDIGLRCGPTPLTAMMLVMVTFIGSFIAIYSVGYMHGDPGYPRFFAEVALFIFSMTTLVLADNFILLYAGWEGVGLCSYLLIGFWFTKPAAADAARKAFLVTRIGDVGLFLGILLLWCHFGSIELRLRLDHVQTSASRADACTLTIVALARPACCSSAARRASRRSSRCTSGCRTRWKARRRSAP